MTTSTSQVASPEVPVTPLNGDPRRPYASHGTQTDHHPAVASALEALGKSKETATVTVKNEPAGQTADNTSAIAEQPSHCYLTSLPVEVRVMIYGSLKIKCRRWEPDWTVTYKYVAGSNDWKTVWHHHGTLALAMASKVLAQELKTLTTFKERIGIDIDAVRAYIANPLKTASLPQDIRPWLKDVVLSITLKRDFFEAFRIFMADVDFGSGMDDFEFRYAQNESYPMDCADFRTDQAALAEMWEVFGVKNRIVVTAGFKSWSPSPKTLASRLERTCRCSSAVFLF